MANWTLITGASTGLGVDFAHLAARDGHNIILTARSEDKLTALADELREKGSEVAVIPADLSKLEEAERLWATATDGRHIDVLVNNAGAYLERGAFVDSDPDLWWKTMEVNVRGPYLMSRHLVAAMHKGGKIINLTSGKGFSAGANSSAYHVSKAALNMMTEGLANELWSRDIEVNSLVPGPTATATFDNAESGAERSPEDILSAGPDSLPKGLPAGERVQHPDDVAKMALQIASYPSGGPTGQIFSLARRPM